MLGRRLSGSLGVDMQIEPQIVRKGGLGSAMAGGNPTIARSKDDFYATPHEVTQALLQTETFTGRIWEPFGGDGAIVKVLKRAGYKDVVASDINPRAEGIAKRSVFDVKTPVAHCIISNPPFQLADGKDVADVIEHLLSLRPRKLALMLKSTFWHAKGRAALFERTKPAAIYPLLWRPDFLGLGRPTMEVMWCVWKWGNAEYPIYRPLLKPAPAPRETLMTPAETRAIESLSQQ